MSRPHEYGRVGHSRQREERLPTLVYEDGKPFDNLRTFLVRETCVQVSIAPEHMARHQRQIRQRSLWGDRVYTEDSDLVAVLVHLGYFPFAMKDLPIPSNVKEIKAVIRPLPEQDRHISANRNGVRSRAWGNKVDACSYKVEKCFIVTHEGREIQLKPGDHDGLQVAPTYALTAQDRGTATRSSGPDRRQRGQQEQFAVVYNLCNEPWLKYSISNIADRGLRETQRTSHRLLTEVLFVETATTRYEISRTGSCPVIPRATANGTSSANGSAHATVLEHTFQFAQCLKPLPVVVMKRLGLPLPASCKKVLAHDLPWEAFRWTTNGLHVQEQHLHLRRLHFMTRTALPLEPEAAMQQAATPEAPPAAEQPPVPAPAAAALPAAAVAAAVAAANGVVAPPIAAAAAPPLPAPEPPVPQAAAAAMPPAASTAATAAPPEPPAPPPQPAAAAPAAPVPMQVDEPPPPPPPPPQAVATPASAAAAAAAAAAVAASAIPRGLAVPGVLGAEGGMPLAGVGPGVLSGLAALPSMSQPLAAGHPLAMSQGLPPGVVAGGPAAAAPAAPLPSPLPTDTDASVLRPPRPADPPPASLPPTMPHSGAPS